MSQSNEAKVTVKAKRIRKGPRACACGAWPTAPPSPSSCCRELPHEEAGEERSRSGRRPRPGRRRRSRSGRAPSPPAGGRSATTSASIQGKSWKLVVPEREEQHGHEEQARAATSGAANISATRRIAPTRPIASRAAGRRRTGCRARCVQRRRSPAGSRSRPRAARLVRERPGRVRMRAHGDQQEADLLEGAAAGAASGAAAASMSVLVRARSSVWASSDAHVLGPLQRADVVDDRPAILGDELVGVGRHLVLAARDDVEDAAVLERLAPASVCRRRRRGEEIGADDAAVAVRRGAVAGDADTR